MAADSLISSKIPYDSHCAGNSTANQLKDFVTLVSVKLPSMPSKSLHSISTFSLSAFIRLLILIFANTEIQGISFVPAATSICTDRQKRNPAPRDKV